MTIGISTVRRSNDDEYLQQTLDDLLKHLSPAELSDVTLVVFLADNNATYRQEVLQRLTSKYHDLLEQGSLNIIQAKPEFYPSLENLKQKYNDSETRIKWRSKQVLDFALLFLYASDKAEYHLQLEDDVISAPDYFTSIKAGLAKYKGKMWTVLSFSQIGFIGHFFKSEDLVKLSKYMVTFFDEQPVDWLVGSYMTATGQKGRISIRPSLFQHIGTMSSLPGKIQKVVDRGFKMKKNGKEQPGACVKSNNPEAMVLDTDMVPYGGFSLKQLYFCSGHFWASNAGQNKTITIVFKDTENVLGLEVASGPKERASDFLEHGLIKFAQSANCEQGLSVMGNFTMGRFKIELNSPQPVKCIRLEVTQDQENWVRFSHFFVKTDKNQQSVRKP